MKTINVVILNPIFLVVFLGTAAASAFCLIFSLTHWQTPNATYLLAGSFCYLIGIFLVTMVFNVPMNDALQAAAPGSEEEALGLVEALAVQGEEGVAVVVGVKSLQQR